jgi:hypothetical protein
MQSHSTTVGASARSTRMSQVNGASGKLIFSTSPTAAPDTSARLVHQPVMPSRVVSAAYAAAVSTPSSWIR